MMKPLVDPPVIPYYLLEEPFGLVAVLGGCGLICLVVGYWWHAPRLRVGGGVCLALAGVIYGLAWLVVTDREDLIAQTQRAVDLTAPLEAQAVREMLTPGATLEGPSGEVWLELNTILDELTRLHDQQWIKEQQVVAIEAQVDSSEAGLTQLDLRTTLATPLGDRPVKTLWLIHWSRHDDAPWRIAHVRWLVHPEPLGIHPSRGAWRATP